MPLPVHYSSPASFIDPNALVSWKRSPDRSVDSMDLTKDDFPNQYQLQDNKFISSFLLDVCEFGQNISPAIMLARDVSHFGGVELDYPSPY